ncbi:MAG: hypothetical protein FWG40_07170 [Peptococcaceae bacterium]|nr:hypothetical protein [Peptococcaceae bacterium]
MFVGKDELINARKLTGQWLHNTRFNWLFMSVTFAFVFLGNIMTLFNYYSETSRGIRTHQIMDYSRPVAFGLVGALVIMMLLYKTTDTKCVMFPQTGTSRFLAEKARYYCLIGAAGLNLVVYYFVAYALIGLWGQIVGDTMFANRFSIGFTLAGLLAWLLYMSIVLETMLALRLFIMKFRILSAVGLVLLVLLTIIDFAAIESFGATAIGALILERGLGFFLLKGIALWVLLFALSMVINKISLQDQSSRSAKQVITDNVTLAITVVAALVFVIVFIPQSLDSRIPRNLVIPSEEAYELTIPEFDPGPNRFVMNLDASGIPRGSSITITTIDVVKANDATQSVPDSDYYPLPEIVTMLYTVQDEQALLNFTGNEIRLEYWLPTWETGGIDMTRYIQPRFSARLDGNTLCLEYQYTLTSNAFFLPMWSFMEQFDTFKEKGIFYESAMPLFYNTRGERGWILISVD